MATTSTKPSPSSTRRTAGSASPTPSSFIARGATARAAASPRPTSSLNSSSSRRPASKGATPVNAINGETHESLSASLKQETDQKEQLLVQLQNKEQTISTLASENDNLTSALNAAETRLNELYTDQSRSEMELAQRIDISEKLRTQVRELEKEKRDLQRRYNEQTTTFEAERQAFYDSEQHLKSRILSLTQARKNTEPVLTAPEPESEAEPEDEDELPQTHKEPEPPKPDFNDPEMEPAEMTALKLELSTLSTSYSSMQSTLVLLQSQLVDLKRVNRELQEENESFMILLREKTLSGQFDLMKQVGGGSVTSEDDDDDDDARAERGDEASLHSIGKSTLDRVDEEPIEHGESLEFLQEAEFMDPDVSSSRNSRHPSRQGRRRTLSSAAPPGESLADLPITGPGLDLAAELGRAENKDILAGAPIDDRDQSVLNGKKRSKKTSDGRKVSSSEAGAEPTSSATDIDALRTEVKSLKDANKALSLYASKIIDRIIAQEGFEHVLAVDYEKEPATPSTAHPNTPAAKPQPKQRPQSVIVGSNSATNSDIRPLLTPTTSKPSNAKTQRRSLSFDWKNFSLFNSSSEKKPESNLRQLTLTPGVNAVTSARKLDTQEDEEDRKERERLNATMKLMGIQPAPQSPYASLQKAQSSDAPSPVPTASSNRRFSLFGSKAPVQSSDTSSIHSSRSLNDSRSGLGAGSGLTQEALEHAEVENSLAALDTHERNLSAEIARGGGSGFTEIAPRVSRRSRRSVGGSGSGSTVWSAGMSGEGDDQ